MPAPDYTDPADALAAGSAGAPTAAAPGRTVLALGLAGALGEELLALLMARNDVRQVVVGVTQPMGSASARFAPWVVGSSLLLADEAWIAVTGDETFVPAASPIVRYDPAQLVAAARIARDCGVRRLVVVSPLAALMQMSAGASTLGSSEELALVELGFEQLVVVRPTADDARERGGSLPQRLVRSAARAVADIMLPGYARTLSAASAARAIVQAARSAPPTGTTVFGARDLMKIVQARFPELAPAKQRLR